MFLLFPDFNVVSCVLHVSAVALGLLYYWVSYSALHGKSKLNGSNNKLCKSHLFLTWLPSSSMEP